MSKKNIEIEEYNPASQLADFMASNKTGHFNNEKDYDYKVPTGSLNLDIHINGGFMPGIVRFVGFSGGGKSAASQSVIKEFLDLHQNARAVIIPSEGKRVENLARKQGLFKCVTDPTEWENKSCFIYRTNIYENAMRLIRDLVENNPTNTRYVFVIDSMDALIPEGDFDKGLDEAVKVAGGALLSSTFLKQTSLMISSRGHLVILISQARAKVEVSKYVVSDKKPTNASGGFALIHYADWIMEFKDYLTQADKIWDGPPGPKGKILGHYCEIYFAKTPCNKTGTSVRYPIKYHENGSGSVWHAHEIVDTLLMWGQVKSSGAWCTFNSALLNELHEAGFTDIPEKVNGAAKLKELFEVNPDVTNFLIDKFRALLTS